MLCLELAFILSTDTHSCAAANCTEDLCLIDWNTSFDLLDKYHRSMAEHTVHHKPSQLIWYGRRGFCKESLLFCIQQFTHYLINIIISRHHHIVMTCCLHLNWFSSSIINHIELNMQNVQSMLSSGSILQSFGVFSRILVSKLLSFRSLVPSDSTQRWTSLLGPQFPDVSQSWRLTLISSLRHNLCLNIRESINASFITRDLKLDLFIEDEIFIVTYCCCR